MLSILKKLRKKKGEGAEAERLDLLTLLIKPSYIKNYFDCIQLNNNLNRVIMAVGYPRVIKEGWLDSIVSAEGDFDLSMYIEPSPIGSMMTNLNNELVKQKADLATMEMKGVVNPALQVQYEDTFTTLSRLQKGEEKLFDFSLYVNARANSKEKLELLSRKIESELNAMMIIPKIPFLRMQDALQSVIPVQQNKLRASRNITSGALSACFPFTTSFLSLDVNGVMFGLNRDNNIPVILDVYNFTNYNGLVLGSSGSGKSYGIKLYILRNLLKGVKTMIIDPQGEYIDLTKTYGGQVVEISRKSDTIINPFDLMGHDYGDKMLSLMDLFRIMCGDLTEVQKNILDKAIDRIYQEKGILPNDNRTWNRKAPIMEDLYKVLIDEKKHASRLQKVTYEALENRIRIYAKGSFSFLNKQTNIDLNKNLVSFNIMDMPNQVKPVMMFLILDFIHKKMQKDKERKLLVVDEAWTLLRHGEHANYIFELIKTARKFGLGLVIISQEVNDLLSSKAGKTVLANTAWKLLLRQEPAVMKELVEKFNLNKEEQNFILTSSKGEGLLFAMNDHLPIKIVASEKEHEVITTNPDELMAKTRKKDARKKRELEYKDVYHLQKSFYLKNELDENQIDFLVGEGFMEFRQPAFKAGRGNYYLVKPPEGNQRSDHFFLVELIYEEIEKYTDRVVKEAKYGDGRPDVRFAAPYSTVPGKEVIIEVETGTALKDKKCLMEKVALHNQQEYEWFFVVTDAKLKKTYEKFHETLTRTEVPKRIKKLFGGKKKEEREVELEKEKEEREKEQGFKIGF